MRQNGGRVRGYEDFCEAQYKIQRIFYEMHNLNTENTSHLKIKSRILCLYLITNIKKILVFVQSYYVEAVKLGAP